MKPLRWVGSALADLRAFPPDARRIGGHNLHLIQLGLEADDWKPCFEKKSRQTSARDLVIGRERYKTVVRESPRQVTRKEQEQEEP